MFWCTAGRCVSRGFITARHKTISLSAVNSRNHRPTVRRVYTTPCTCSDDPVKQQDRPVLGSWEFVVDPFCSVRSRLGCGLAVSSLDPHAFPEADRAFVVVYGPGVGQPGVLDPFDVHYDGQSKELSILADKVTCEMTVELTTSIKSNLNIVTHGAGAVHIKNMDCDVCRVQTGQGSCTLQSVKGHVVEVRSDGGHVTGVGTIHGNVDISTSGDGAVNVKKLQGTTMRVRTERGSLKVKAIYAEATHISSSSGTVELGHVHGDATVKTLSGDVVINGSNGSLEARSDSGNIDAYVGQTGSAEVSSQSGAVCVRVPSSLRARADLHGTSVEVSPEVTLQEAKRVTTEGQTQITGYVNGDPGTEQSIRAEARQGAVRLKTQSWFESLRLQSG